MKTSYLIFAIFLFFAQGAFAQSDTVVGILLDVNRKAIKKYPVTLGSVSPVTVKTDKNGLFTFTNANLQDTLFVGDKKGKNLMAIPINGHNILSIMSQKGDFNTEYDSEELEQIRRDIRQLQNSVASSLNTVRLEDIDESKCIDIECLVTRLSGVTIAAGGAVRIGGGSYSLYGSSGALIVLDGVDIGYSIDAISYLKPVDIVNISVSRDGANYGVRGAAGILLVNTKKR